MKRLITTLGLILVATLSGCSSISQQQCVRGDWFDIGFDHGLQGYSLGKGKEIVYECLDYAVRPNLVDYKRGHQEGLKDYCQPENGFQLGLRGASYNGICASESFRQAWLQGHDRYTIVQRRAELNEQLSNIESRLRSIAYSLYHDELTREQRQELRHQRHRLKHEQDALRHERALLPIIPDSSAVFNQP